VAVIERNEGIFLGGDREWDGVIVHEVDDMPIYTGIGNGGIDVSPVYLMGQEASGGRSSPATPRASRRTTTAGRRSRHARQVGHEEARLRLRLRRDRPRQAARCRHRLLHAGTTNTLDIGVAGTPAGLAPTAAVLPAATGFKQNLTGTLTGIPLAANTIVYAKYAQTGTAATTGKAHIVLKFATSRKARASRSRRTNRVRAALICGPYFPLT
jgi:hypothetical protein